MASIAPMVIVVIERKELSKQDRARKHGDGRDSIAHIAEEKEMMAIWSKNRTQRVLYEDARKSIPNR